MQLLIDKGFTQDPDTQQWWHGRAHAYVSGDNLTVLMKHVYKYERAPVDDLVQCAAFLDEAVEGTKEDTENLIKYGTAVQLACNQADFHINYFLRYGELYFHMAKGPAYDLFSLDMDTNGDFEFRTDECRVIAEENPVPIEIEELFSVMKSESSYDGLEPDDVKGVKLHNCVALGGNVYVYANMCHALHDCLLYGVKHINQEVVSIGIPEWATAIKALVKEGEFPVLKAFTITFLRERAT